jgi:peroxiredoxin Q/BCP
MKRVWGVLAAMAIASSTAAWAVKEGDVAPPFRAMSTSGAEVGLDDFAGSWLVLYFYPKSFTPGCTAQGCSLRDGYASIAEAGARILGASVDTLETQIKFKAEHRLPFDLLADENAAVARAYGVIAMMGRMARRVTFIISPQGRIARVIEDAQTRSHDQQVLAALREAQAAAP